MEIHEFYIPSSSGIANLHCMEWIPSGEVKAIVQIAHGMMEHVGRYREFAEFLAGHGIYVLGNDHLGHGKTAAAAEDRGYFGDIQFFPFYSNFFHILFPRKCLSPFCFQFSAAAD